MPLYEYQCDACGHRFEKIQKFSDALVDECPKCGAKAVHKLVSSPAIQFKGSGWYITDYAKKGATGADGSKTGEAKGSGEGADKADKSEKASKDDKSATKDDKTASAPSPSTTGSTDSAASSTTPSTKS